MIKLDPERQSVNPGDRASILCTVTSGGQPIQLGWSREDGGPLRESIRQNEGLIQVITDLFFQTVPLESLSKSFFFFFLFTTQIDVAPQFFTVVDNIFSVSPV